MDNDLRDSCPQKHTIYLACVMSRHATPTRGQACASTEAAEKGLEPPPSTHLAIETHARRTPAVVESSSLRLCRQPASFLGDISKLKKCTQASSSAILSQTAPSCWQLAQGSARAETAGSHTQHLTCGVCDLRRFSQLRSEQLE
jgi:hypothetical protein